MFNNLRSIRSGERAEWPVICADSSGPARYKSGVCVGWGKGLGALGSSWLLIIIVMTMAATAGAGEGENDWFVYLGNNVPPKAPRKSISAAEALPPLPLPATPLRRTERKKPPQPNYLIGKVIWGESASFTTSSGKKMSIADWNLCPTDAEKFVENARRMELDYHWCNVNLKDFHFDSKKLPALLFSGVRTLRLGEAHIQSLREYVLNGGMIICDSIAGSPFFYEAAKKVFLGAFPQSRLRVIPSDHPVYHIFGDVEKVAYPKNRESATPVLEGIYVGSRIGVLISKYGLGCGWNCNLESLDKLPKAIYYDVDSASRIGLNLAGYIVGYAEVGLREGQPEVFGLTDQKPPSDEFVFAQIKHEGAWNVHPGAATALLMKLRRHTAVRVNLKRVAVDPAKDELSGYPFLYLSGLDDFTFSPQAVAALQQFLHREGVLLISNGMGLKTFDQAVRRELGKILPGGELQVIGGSHDLYNCLFLIEQVEYSAAVKAAERQKNQPYLLGVLIGGDLRVIYSPYDLEAGWLESYYPLMRGYQPLSAQQLGMNIITYAMTH